MKRVIASLVVAGILGGAAAASAGGSPWAKPINDRKSVRDTRKVQSVTKRADEGVHAESAKVVTRQEKTNYQNAKKGLSNKDIRGKTQAGVLKPTPGGKRKRHAFSDWP